jgi:S1-C subfamily serine protease
MRLFVAFFTALLTTAAGAWDVVDINKAVDQTNFVVNRGCSGTLISLPNQLVLTNHHCVDNLITSYEREISNSDGYVKKVRMRRYADVALQQFNYDGFAPVGSAAYIGEIVAEDQSKDLALVRVRGKIPHTYASPLLPEDKVVLRGERVYVVGNPAGEYGSVVAGIVSSVNRTFEFPWTNREKLGMIQFSGGIYGGNSGGALYNDQGELIGVPAAGYMGANFIGLAVPVSVVKTFMRANCFAIVFDVNADDGACLKNKIEKEKKDKAW